MLIPNEQRSLIHFSVSEKNTTLRLEPSLRARAEDEARRRGWSLSSLGAWLLRQALELEFLEPVNRQFVCELLAQLGAPWSALDVINALVSAARREISRGKIRPTFWKGQFGSLAKNGEELSK